MDGPSTRERILAAALELCGRKGCAGTSMEDIAAAVGIRAPSLYRHFPSKSALFAAVAAVVAGQYDDLRAQMARAHAKLVREVHGPGTLRPEGLEEETLAWVRQERDAPGRRAFVQAWGQDGPRALWLWEEPLALYTQLFSQLMDRQGIKRADAQVMAAEYLAPVLALLTLADWDPRRRETLEEDVSKHVRQFCRAFAVKQRPAAPSSPTGGVRGFFRR